MKSLIKKLLREGLDVMALNEDITSGSVIVYHRTGKRSESPVKGIASDGYRIASGFGARYGPGVYTTYTLESQLNDDMKIYGDIIIESKVKSVKNFLIFDYDIAKRIYGNKNYTLDKQLRIILGGKFDKYKNDDNLKNLIEQIPTVTYTEDVARTLVDKYEYLDIVSNISGMIFTSENDGNVLVCYDRKNIEPIRYTMNEGKTWKNILDKNIYQRIKGYDPEDKSNITLARIQNKIDTNQTSMLSADEVMYLLNAYKNGNDFAAEFFNNLDTKLVGNLVSGVPEEYKLEIINQIFPLVKDKLDYRMIGVLLMNSPEEYKLEMINQIFSLVKDKLDDDIANKLLDTTPEKHKLETINQIIPFIKDKLGSYPKMVANLLRYTPEEDRFNKVKQIFPLVEDKLDYKIVWSLLQYTPEEDRLKMINRIFPLVKDRLDEENMTYTLLEFTPKKHKEYLQGLINKAKGQS